MNRAESPSMISFGTIQAFLRTACLVLCLSGLFPISASALEKEGMPDLSQIEQTCLPTSTANLIVWFGLHGYPKLIAPGDSKQNGYITTVHDIMNATDARFDWGTRPEKIAIGIRKYIEDAGYQCSVEFRGLGKTTFDQKWLTENDAPNKGFILLLAYCNYDRSTDTYSNAWDAGHAVTLVNAMPDMLLIHDPAHNDDETGRKILTPQVVTSGTWVSKGGSAPVAGLLLLSGSLLEAPPEAGVILIGAVCITMHPAQDMVASSSSDSSGGPNTTIGGGGSPASSPSTPQSTTKSWTEWLFDELFAK